MIWMILFIAASVVAVVAVAALLYVGHLLSHLMDGF